MEYGNDFTSSSLINPNDDVSGEITESNSVDFFRFNTGTIADRVVIQFIAKDYVELSVNLYDGDQNLLVSQYDEVESDYILITHNEPTTTSFYLEVKARASDEFGDYRFQVWSPINGLIPAIHTTEHRHSFERPVFMMTQGYPMLGMEYLELTEYVVPYQLGYFQTNTKTIKTGEIGVEITGIVPPKQFFEQRIIMMGSKSGVSVPFRYYGTPKHHIGGTVMVDGATAKRKTLRLYDRDSGQMLSETKTDELGRYEFTTPLWKDSKYYVIAFDDMNAPDLQAIVIDALVPIEQ